jgi:hypothetical protein
VEPNNKLATLSQELLPKGSRIRHAFMCQAAPHVWFFVINYLTYLTIFWIRYRVVCVTDDAIYVLRASKFAIEPKELLATLPRSTQLGPVSGRWAKIQLLVRKRVVSGQAKHPGGAQRSRDGL